MGTTDIREMVKDRYGKIAERDRPAAASTCCGGGAPSTAQAISQAVGYGKAEMESVPEGANLGLGCGNPVALASLREGDTVLDLGSGAGFDCFLAAKKVGPSGRVIGVDMTPEMLAKARVNATKGGYSNVEFREGHIEKLPVADNSVDVIISNCVINLSPDKAKVFAEMHRVLKPGGRFFVSDLVLLEELPESVRSLPEIYCACIGGASLKHEYFALMAAAGFREVRIAKEAHYPSELFVEDSRARELLKKTPGLKQEDLVKASQSLVSVQVEGSKAAAGACCGGRC